METVKIRRHHNNKGLRQIRRGRTREQIATMAERLTCEIRPDGSGAFCCNEFVAEIEDPETDGLDSGKPYYIDEGRVYDARGARVVVCPYCGSEIHTKERR